MNPHDYLGTLVVARTTQGTIKTVGCVVAVADFPTCLIVDMKGNRTNWAVHLCKTVTEDKEIVKELIPDETLAKIPETEL